MSTQDVTTAATETPTLSVEERKAALARIVANTVGQGWRVESQSDYQAIFIKGRHVRHFLHAVLTVLTAGLWAVVWITMWLIYHERHKIASVDEYGSVAFTKA